MRSWIRGTLAVSLVLAALCAVAAADETRNALVKPPAPVHDSIRAQALLAEAGYPSASMPATDTAT